MSITAFQRDVCQLLASSRSAGVESYVAGGLALNAVLGGTRYSEDIDLFHDTEEAVKTTLRDDRLLLESAGYSIEVTREFGTFIEAKVSKGDGFTTLQWSFDSAFRFYPLMEHPELGITLNPFDLATNKTLALVGRLVPRDWVDLILCCERLQPLGYLAWAASGKDPGLSPTFILSEARRSSRYVQVELDTMEFDGPTPSAVELSVKWRQMLTEADSVVALLPEDHVGEVVLDASGNLLQVPSDKLGSLIETNGVRFHPGAVKGAVPTILHYL